MIKYMTSNTNMFSFEVLEHGLEYGTGRPPPSPLRDLYPSPGQESRLGACWPWTNIPLGLAAVDVVGKGYASIFLWTARQPWISPARPQ